MRKRLINIYILCVLVCCIYGCAKADKENLVSEMETVGTRHMETEDANRADTGHAISESEETALSEEEYRQIMEEIIPLDSVDDQDKDDLESLDILREIEKYRSQFIGLYTSNALSEDFPDVEPAMSIEEQDFPSDTGEGASLTVYSRLSSGAHLRYELHYFGETGNSVINYYLCDDFVWVSRQYNCYSSNILRADYTDVLYSTIENWIITDEAAYIMHDSGELEETDRTQLQMEIPMPNEIKASVKEQRQAEIFYQVAEEGYGLSHEEAQGWFDRVTEDDVFGGGINEIRDLIFDDIDDNGETDMIIMMQEPEEEFMPGTGEMYFYMNADEPYCFMDENFPFFRPMNICYADFNGDGNVEIAFALKGTGNSGVGDWYKAMLRYTGNTMKRLEFPSDFKPDYSHDDEVGLTVDVNMEPEPDTYTAYCPYLDESITFHASNYWEEDARQAALARDPLRGGCNCRGYFYLQAVTWEGRDALQVREYLYGEGGPSHFVGWAYFILIWDEQGNGSVADWWIEEEFDEWWETLIRSDILPIGGH